MDKKLILGTQVKITGGKYKRLDQGILKTLKPTYCDVEFAIEDGSKAIHKVKIDYIFPVDSMVIDMPEAEQLADVQQDPDDFIKENPELMKQEPEPEPEVEEEDDLPQHPDDEEFDNLEDQIDQLEKKAVHFMDESAVFEAERDQADAKVMEQDEEIEKLKSRVIALTGRNQYLEGLCRKILLP
tara:strand:+ start:3701 stop:4252 length:552 start_codon:yes stop_codon:yes gene_type:complete